jgi:hypothetical protein
VLAAVLAMFSLGLPTTPGAAAGSPELTVSIGSASVVLTAQGRPSILFPVTLSTAATSTVSVAYSTRSGTAQAGKSFRAASGKITFSVNDKTGKTPVTVFTSVSVNPSSAGATPGGFTITLSNPQGVSLGNAVGVGRILPRAAGAAVRVYTSDMSIYGGTSGGSRLGRVHVTLSRPAPKPVTVSYSVASASAVAGKHFRAPKSGQLKIANGGLAGWVDVKVVSGSVTGAPRSLSVKLTKSVGATISRAKGVITIMPEPSALLFDDEFNGPALDLSKWQPNWLGENNATITKPIHSLELSCYDPSQVSQPGDGYLHLTAVARTCRADNGITYNYASGLVEARPYFTFTYGYLEARMWLPANDGQTANWPAFWADGTGSWPTTGELDVMEGLHGSDCFHFHSPGGAPGGCAALDAPAGWHTFGARWAPGSVTFFYDGQEVGEITDGVTDAPMYPIVNLGVGGQGGAPFVPSTVLVDWVRITR